MADTKTTTTRMKCKISLNIARVLCATGQKRELDESATKHLGTDLLYLDDFGRGGKIISSMSRELEYSN